MELDTDPDATAVECLPLIQFHAAFEVTRRNDADEIRRWEGDPFMKMVIDFDFDDVEEEIANGDRES